MAVVSILFGKPWIVIVEPLCGPKYKGLEFGGSLRLGERHGLQPRVRAINSHHRVQAAPDWKQLGSLYQGATRLDPNYPVLRGLDPLGQGCSLYGCKTRPSFTVKVKVYGWFMVIFYQENSRTDEHPRL